MDKKIAPYEGKEPYIFVSYSHQDEDFVYPMIRNLTENGYRIWYDDGIHTGDNWLETIAGHLNGSRICLAVITSNAANSHNCKNEINLALEQKIMLLPILHEKFEMSLGMRLLLGSTQYIKEYDYSMDNPSDAEAFYNDLLRAEICQLCREKEFYHKPFLLHIKEVAKQEPQRESKPEPTPEAKPKPEPMPEVKPEPTPEAKPKPEPMPEVKPEPTPEAKPEPEPTPKKKPSKEPKKPQREIKPESKPEPTPEPTPEAKPKPEPTPEVKQEPMPEPQRETKPKPEPEPTPKGEPSKEPKKPQPEAKPELMPEAKSEPEPVSEPEWDDEEETRAAIYLPKESERQFAVLIDVNSGTVYRLSEHTTIGRDKSSQICLADKTKTIGRRHAEIRLGNGKRTTLTDLDSMNGTFLSGRRLEKGSTVALNNYSTISLAGRSLLYLSNDSARAALSDRKIAALECTENEERIALSPNFVLGRKNPWPSGLFGPNDAVQKYLSREHGSFILEENGFRFIAGQHSANGTFLNHIKLDPGQRSDVLREGDEIDTAGRHTFKYMFIMLQEKEI